MQNNEELNTQGFTTDYFQITQEYRRRSAQEIIPILVDLFHPSSLVDVGCGLGDWLIECKRQGIEDIQGIDGEHIEQSALYIPTKQFLVADLSKPLKLERQFNLVLSLEVAEHLPAESAEIFVDSLIQLGQIVVFSAAIPSQGGIGHLNEQWPSYWVKYFEKRGYLVVDCLRKKVWENPNVACWYAQNMLLFVHPEAFQRYPFLQQEHETTLRSQLDLVHPNMFLMRLALNQLNISSTEYRKEDVERWFKWFAPAR
jgi:hypothetical protein